MAGRLLPALIVALALALTGCDSVPGGTPPAEAALAPGVEALAYLPAGADVVVVVDTETDGKRWRAARDAARRAGVDGRLDRVVARLADAGLDVAHGEQLLGNLLAWAPREQVAALVVRDSTLLADLATTRVRAGLMRDAGVHRAARVLQGDGIAIAIDGPVVVAAPTTAAVRRALDRRAAGEGYGAERFKRAVAQLPVDALVRIAVDARALVARHAPRWRAIPLARALERAGFALRVAPRGATLDARIDLSERLLGDDVPLPGDAGHTPRTATPRPFGGVHVGVADLPRLARAAYRAAFAAAPAAVARAEIANLVLRGRRRIDPARDLVAALAGPATLQVDADGVLVRAALRDRRRAEKAIGRLSARLPRILAAVGVDGVVMQPLAGLKAAVREQDVLAVFGVADDVLLAGDGRPRELLERARTDSADDDDPAPGPIALRAGPRAAAELLGIDGAHEVRGWARWTGRGLRAGLTVRLDD